MKLEVANKSDPETYWVASIIMTCGQLLLLRYDGYGEDRRADFWCDIMTADLHPIGWCGQNNKVLRPPEGIRDKYSDWGAFLVQTLSGASSAPAALLEGPHRGRNPLDLLAPGSLLELQDREWPLQAWLVVVEENTGGRLRFRYAGAEKRAEHRRWLFYLDPFLHPVGWARQQGLSLTPPAAVRGLKSDLDWQEVLQGVLGETVESAVPEQFFKDKPVIGTHSFSAGMKLEAVDPAAPFTISPATVTKVFSEKYFLVQIDDLRSEQAGASAFVCHVTSGGIFPVQWCLKNGVHLTPPKGYPGQDFDWADYLKQCSSEAAPQHCFSTDLPDFGYTENMKLEAVNPLSPEEIHAATVTKVKGQHIWLHLEGSKKPVPECIVHVESMDIFPVSWCETNGYPLSHPRKPKVKKQRKVAVVQPEKQVAPRNTAHDGLRSQDYNSSESGLGNGKYCCPKIYFNHRCFSGPYLNKGRIAELPQCVGPGSCALVLKEVLTLLINAAYKPSRVLRELQLDEEARWQGYGETLKAKYKGKSYRATVEIVRTADQVPDFCRKTCIKLECCPNLFGPRMALERCSENCSGLTKTKYTHYYGKKRSKRIGRPPGGHTNLEGGDPKKRSKRIGRPPGGHTNLEGGVKKPSKRRKRRKHFFVHKKKRSPASLDNTPAGSPQGSGEEEDLDEEESGSEDSGSEQQDELMEDSEVSEKKSQPSSPSQGDKRKRKSRTIVLCVPVSRSCVLTAGILKLVADAVSGLEDSEFNWDEYLEETGTTAAPHSSFKHVLLLQRSPVQSSPVQSCLCTARLVPTQNMKPVAVGGSPALPPGRLLIHKLSQPVKQGDEAWEALRSFLCTIHAVYSIDMQAYVSRYF
ncbi:Scm-like with four MBT domains protein 1 [Acipenser ruthenus]|uniref:Scm-like with four MBT domains protein 1 n=1 Tax=Acipenser ruthenus TaxID=7906 RepID=A0A444UWZ9_ACIRT|nr:Scm-like with four MBT domains protein 1 [Acipenser ruthenus]